MSRDDNRSNFEIWKKIALTVDLTADVKHRFSQKNFIVTKVRGDQVV